MTRLVVFDTWLRNCDRHPPDLSQRKPNFANVFLAETEKKGRLRLFAIDHTHGFDCGRDFSEKLAHIDRIRDDRAFGLFPEFTELIDSDEVQRCMVVLKGLQKKTVEDTVSAIPPEWEVSSLAKTALIEQIVQRASFIADRIELGWKISS